jgi:hypothetical protein
MIITGSISRTIDNQAVDIPSFIDTVTGTYSQWGHDTLVLGSNVDLLEALRDTACDHD